MSRVDYQRGIVERVTGADSRRTAVGQFKRTDALVEYPVDRTDDARAHSLIGIEENHPIARTIDVGGAPVDVVGRKIDGG